MNYNGWLSIHYATYFKRLPVIIHLASLGCDLNARDDNGYTPLHICMYSRISIDEKLAIVKFFIDQGVDLNTVNNKGYTPLHLAASLGLTDIVLLLIDNGADVDARTVDGNLAEELAHEYPELSRVIANYSILLLTKEPIMDDS